MPPSTALLDGVQIFFWGFAGSVAVEVVTLLQIMQADELILPGRYKRFAFWVVRVLVAVVAGGLAVAYEINKPLLAANIGAATPLLIQALAQGVRPGGINISPSE